MGRDLTTLAALLERQLPLGPHDIAPAGRGEGFPVQVFQSLKLLQRIVQQQSINGGPGDLRTVWASPNGNDSNPGSVLEPVKTLQRAHDVAREFLAEEPALVRLSPGDYEGATITHKRLGIFGAGIGDNLPGTRVTTPIILAGEDASYGVDSVMIRGATLVQGISTAPGAYANFLQNGMVFHELGVDFPGAATIQKGTAPTGPFVVNDAILGLGGPLDVELDEIVFLGGFVQGNIFRHASPTPTNLISFGGTFFGPGGLQMANGAYTASFFNCTLYGLAMQDAASQAFMHACSLFSPVTGPGIRYWLNTPAYGAGPPGPGTHFAMVGETYVDTAVPPPGPNWLYRQTAAPFGSTWIPVIQP